MAETFFPFDSGPGANTKEQQWMKMARNWVQTGVIKGQLNDFQVYADSSGMQIKVKSGQAWIQGVFYQSDAEIVLPISTADATNDRIDRVVIRVDWVANTVGLAILQGTPATNPVPPALTQNTAKWEIALADITIPANAVTITANDVTSIFHYTQPSNGYINPNIIFNPTGALGLQGWSQVGSTTGWTPGFGGAGYGSYFQSPNLNAITSTISLESAPVNIYPGTSLSVQGEILTVSATAGQAYLELVFYDSTGNVLSTAQTNAVSYNSGSSWKFVQTNVLTPANTDHVSVRLTTDVGSSGYYAFHKVKLENGLNATPWTDDNSLNTSSYGPQLIGVFKDVDTWHNAVFQNGYTNLGGGDAPARYRKFPSGMVLVEGVISFGTVGAAAFTLPSGYRPGYNIVREADNNNAFGEISINSSNGNFEPTNANQITTGWISFSVMYLAEN